MQSLIADSTQLLCPVERGSCHRFQWCTMVLTKDPSWQSSSLCVHRCEVPHKVDCPRSSTVRQVHHQVRCVVVWHLAAGDYDEGTGALPRCVQAYTFCFCFQSNAAVQFRSLQCNPMQYAGELFQLPLDRTPSQKKYRKSAQYQFKPLCLGQNCISNFYWTGFKYLIWYGIKIQ